MAEVKPFKGVLFNPEIVKDISKVTAPPYDVISEKMQDELYKSHDNNIVKLILGKTKPGDSESDNRYTRARECLAEWLQKKILIRDTQDTLYIYEQKYRVKGILKTRTGFIGLMKIEDPRTSNILPHEYTFAGPKEDRLKLIKSVEANLSPVFTIFSDSDGVINSIFNDKVSGATPLFEVKDDAGITNKLFRVVDEPLINRIKGFIEAEV